MRKNSVIGGFILKFYPINLKLKDKKVLIVGAGSVALRKFRRLLMTKAKIKIISPEFNQGFRAYLNQESDQYIFLKRKFREKDVNGQFLIFAATDNPELNEKIAFLAKDKNILNNIIDNAELSDFIIPAAVSRGELLLTVSSGSNLPALSKKIKKELKKDFGFEYQLLLELMKEKRPEIIAEIDEIAVRKEIFNELASDQFLKKIRKKIDQYNLDLKVNLEEIKNKKINKGKTNKNFKKFFREIEAEIDKIIKKLRND